MQKILLIIVATTLFLACSEQVAEETKNMLAQKVALKKIYDKNNSEINEDGTGGWSFTDTDGTIDFDLEGDGTKDWGGGINLPDTDGTLDGDLEDDGTMDWGDGINRPAGSPDYGKDPPGAEDNLPDWAIGDRASITIEKNANGDLYYDLVDSLMNNFKGGGMVTKTETWFMYTLEDSRNIDYNMYMLSYYRGSDDIVWSLESEYTNSNADSITDDSSNNLFTITVPASSLNKILNIPDEPIKRVTTRIWVTGDDGTEVDYMWKGFVDGEGKITIQLVGYAGGTISNEGDSDWYDPYTPVIPPKP